MRKGKHGPKRKSSAPVLAEAKRTRKSEVEVAKDEIEAMGLEITALFPMFDTVQF